MNRQTAGADWARIVARQLSELGAANWIVSEAGWSDEPTKRVFEQPSGDGIFYRADGGVHTTYYLDYRLSDVGDDILPGRQDIVREYIGRLADMNS